MSEKDNIKLSCKIKKIRRIKFFENDPSELHLSHEKIQNSQISMSAGLNFDEKNNFIIIDFDVKCFNENKELFGIKTTHQFHVPELKKTKKEKGIFNIPDQFMLALFATTISATRGMLEMSKTIPVYKDIVLPMVDTAKMLNDLKNKRR